VAILRESHGYLTCVASSFSFYLSLINWQKQRSHRWGDLLHRSLRHRLGNLTKHSSSSDLGAEPFTFRRDVPSSLLDPLYRAGGHIPCQDIFRQWLNPGVYYWFDCDVIFSFGLTNLEACIAWKENVSFTFSEVHLSLLSQDLFYKACRASKKGRHRLSLLHCLCVLPNMFTFRPVDVWPRLMYDPDWCTTQTLSFMMIELLQSKSIFKRFHGFSSSLLFFCFVLTPSSFAALFTFHSVRSRVDHGSFMDSFSTVVNVTSLWSNINGFDVLSRGRQNTEVFSRGFLLDQ